MLPRIPSTFTDVIKWLDRYQNYLCHRIIKRLTRKKDPKSDKIRQLIDEGYPQDQAIAIAYAEERRGKL